MTRKSEPGADNGPELIPLREAKRLAAAAKANGNGAHHDLIPDADDESIEPRATEFSDESLALNFSARYADEFRHVAAWGRWLRWDGVRWKLDETLQIFDAARAVCREIASMCNKPSVSKAIASAKTVAAVVSLARADRRHASNIEQWDADPWHLNTPSGMIDLKRGTMHHHRRDQHMTKVTACGPGGDCPTWLAFLDRVTAGDLELQQFMQRMAGYALTGTTSAHALFFAHGTGANGKSVFINTLSGILGDYATTAPMETFIATNNDQHPTNLAGLRGARLVTAVETEEGRRWAESKIKALTGSDKISARFMRQDFFEFVPQFKLLIAGNHKPSLRSVDEAIRRRMNLIPFTVTIPTEERDENLSDKLKSEWPGIFKWMINGCLDWQTEGLQQPEAVRLATEDYLAAEDALAMWLAEKCRVRDGFSATSGALFASWKTWAELTGEFVGSQKRFVQALENRGFKKGRAGHGGKPTFQGLEVIFEQMTDARRYPDND